MNLQNKKKKSSQMHSNQNYLNFIKKNHKLMNQHLGFITPSSIKTTNIDSHNSCTFNKKQSIKQTLDYRSSVDNVIHDSLSKFKVQNSNASLYQDSINFDDHHNTIYQYVHQKNDQIAANLMLSPSKKQKHQAAKQIVFHLNKNMSQNDRKFVMKPILRYQSIQPASQLNLKFPTIQKRAIQTLVFQPKCQRNLFQNELRDRIRFLQRRTKSNKQETPQTKQQENIQQQQSLSRKKIQQKFKIRQQLYGLLPVFKTPKFINSEKQRKYNNLNKNKLKIQKIQTNPAKQLLQQYLQKNIILTSIQPSTSTTNKKKSVIFNREIIDNSSLKSFDLDSNSKIQQNKDQQLLNQVQNQKNQQKQTVQINKQSQIKNKKKNVVVQMKYDGDLSIYQIKIRQYRQFLFMINLAHRIFDPLLLKDSSTFKPQHRYHYYLGKGNNYLLIKSLLKRRFWWIGEDDIKKANFAWTQLKVNNYYQYQHKAQINNKYYKLDSEHIIQQKKKKKKQKKQDKNNQNKPGFYKAPLPPNDKKIFTNADKKPYDQFLENIDNIQKYQKYSLRLKFFSQIFLKTREEEISQRRCHNHLEYNYFIGNKKALFYNLKQYYDLQNKNVFQIIPLTFHIKSGTTDPNYDQFTKQFKKLAKQKQKKHASKNIWIVKPGQLSNRGQGITVIDQIYQLNTIIKKKQKHFNGTQKTYIVQKYIQKPLLYKGRKFDIRHYMMISRLHGTMRAYWFAQGYIRTSSHQFRLDDIGDEIMHLTNDAIQKYGQNYGKFEQGNKVSYTEFQRYMDTLLGQGKFSFSEQIYPKMKSIALDAVKATYLQLDPNNTQHNFQIFGLDFMIDSNLDVWLIEVNTNPCLELSSKLLARIIPTMVEHAFRLTLDVIFPPPSQYPNSQKYLAPDNPLQRLQFQLIFDEHRDGKQIQQLFSNSGKIDMGQVDEQDQTYENDGKQIELDHEIQ